MTVHIKIAYVFENIFWEQPHKIKSTRNFSIIFYFFLIDNEKYIEFKRNTNKKAM